MSDTTFVMTELGKSLMAASPHRPRQAMQRSQGSDPDEIPEEPTDFRDTQRHHHRPRWRLNWLNELVEVVGTGLASLLSRFFSGSPWLWTRMTVRKACASSARVTYRYQPCQDRTS